MDQKPKNDIPFLRLDSSYTRTRLPTKYLINKRARDIGKEPPFDNKCRLCKTNVKNVCYSCDKLLSFYVARYYLLSKLLLWYGC